MKLDPNKLLLQMEQIAKDKNVLLSNNAIKKARARALLNIPLTQCICDKGNTSKFCISEKCLKDIQENGICGCRTFLRK